MDKCVLDACALIAFTYKEEGADIVKALLINAEKGDVEVYMNKVNLFEVYYNARRSEGLEKADAFYTMIQKMPIMVINGISDEVLYEAGRIKSTYKVSLADSIALGEASVLQASIYTSDHHEFDTIESNESIKWVYHKIWGRQKVFA